MHDRVVLVLANQVFFSRDQELPVRSHLAAPPGPGRDLVGRMHARQGRRDAAQRLGQLALRGDVERIVAAHEQRVGPDLDHERLGDAAVHALAADEEDQVRLQAGDLLELLGDRIHAAIERMPRREVRKDLPGAEGRRLERLGQTHGVGRRALAPHVVTEDQHRALRLAELPGNRLDGLRARRPGALDLIPRGFPDLRFQPLAEEELGADGEVDRAGRRRGGFAERASRRDGDGRRVRRHLIGGARVLGDRAHRFGLGQARERGETAEVLNLGRPVAGDDQQRRAGDLGVEELSGQLVRPAHHVRDDDADLAADPVVAVGHRRHEPLVLADDELLVLVLRERREDPGLRGARIREEIVDPRVLQGLDQQHPAGAGHGLAHRLPLHRISERTVDTRASPRAPHARPRRPGAPTPPGSALHSS